MKKIISTLSIILILLFCLCMTVNAIDYAATISGTANKELVHRGETLEIEFELTNITNPNGIVGLTIEEIVFDDKVLSLNSVDMPTTPEGWRIDLTDASFAPFMIVDDSFEHPINSNESLSFYITFTVLDNASLGNTELTLVGSGVEGVDFDEVLIEFNTIQITVEENCSKINSAALALGSDITLNYYASLSAGQESAQMRFTMNGKETLVDGTKEENEYVFPFGVSPQCMGDNIKAELILGDEVLDTIETYSVLQNCQNLLAKNPSDKLRILIADLLEYGAMSQIYTNYKTDALVNEGITDQTVFTPLADDEANDLYVTYELSTSTNEAYELKAAGVYFDSVNRLYFKLYAEDVTDSNFEVVITDMQGNKVSRLPSEFEEIGENLYMVYTDPIYASELSFSEADEDYYWYTVSLNTVQIKKGKRVLTPVQTLDYYSLASYVYSKQNSSNAMADLAIALYNYGLSAEAYRNAQ